MTRKVDPQSQKIRVLVLDDDRLVRTVLEDLLAADYEFKAVSTYEEFLEIFITFNPNVLLLDVVLPDGNGFEICRELKSYSHFENLFVIMLTASDRKESIEKGYEAGAYDYIRKPFVPYEVKSKVKNCSKIIQYQDKLHSAFDYQLEFSKRLYTLNRLIQKNVTISDPDELVKIFDCFNEILDVGKIEVLFEHNSEMNSVFCKEFDKKSTYLKYSQLREKFKLFQEKMPTATVAKLTNEKADLYCSINPLFLNDKRYGFLIIQRTVPFAQDDRNLVNLSRDYLEMMIERLFYHKEFNEQYNNYRSEVSKVRSIQVSFLPKLNDVPGFDISFTFLPAEDISGDFFDGYFLDEEVYQIVLCDISGHGIASSYIGNEFRSLFRSFSLRKFSPALIIDTVNKIVSRDISELHYFGTVIVCHINVKTSEVIFSSGGHPPLMFYRKSNNRCGMIDKAGPLVGFFIDAVYNDVKFRMSEGDSLLMYTDGITETFSPNSREQFGDKRLLNCFKENAPSASQHCINHILDSVFEFSNYATQDDDITMICVKKK